MSYQDRQKDAAYVLVALRPRQESQRGAWTVRSTSLRAAVAKGRVVRLPEGNKTGELAQPGEFEAKAFRRLSFKQQVSWEPGFGVGLTLTTPLVCAESL